MFQSDRAALVAPGRCSSLMLAWPYLNCYAWGIVGAVPSEHLANAKGDVPVLATNGQLDPLTPPGFADEIRSQFSNSTIV